MSALHTPGPWSIETKGSKHFIDGEDGLTVAYLDRRGVREPASIEANARLIAAAPELLEFAQDVAVWLVAPDLSPEVFSIFEARARAAIAKAKGTP